MFGGELFERRCAEFGWLVFVPEDFITDAQRYGFGDVREMSGPDALRIAYRINHYYPRDAEGNIVQSAVAASLKQMLEELKTERAFVADEVTTLDDGSEGRVASSTYLANIAAQSSLDVYDTPIGEFISLKA